jgi:hypothetical protein
MTYLSEIAMPQFRGALLSCFALSLAIGQFTNAIACQIVNLNSPLEYKRVFYSEFVYVALWGAACLYVPESPGTCSGLNLAVHLIDHLSLAYISGPRRQSS